MRFVSVQIPRCGSCCGVKSQSAAAWLLPVTVQGAEEGSGHRRCYQQPLLKGLDAEALADAGQAGVVGQRFVQCVAQVPAVGEIE
jgi:hypothetical protein